MVCRSLVSTGSLLILVETRSHLRSNTENLVNNNATSQTLFGSFYLACDVGLLVEYKKHIDFGADLKSFEVNLF